MKTRKQRKAEFYEFNEDGKILKRIMLDYGIYFDSYGRLVLDISMDDKRKTIRSAVSIPLRDLFDCLKSHVIFQEKFYFKNNSVILENKSSNKNDKKRRKK